MFVDRKKLPFAGYSIVKEPTGDDTAGNSFVHLRRPLTAFAASVDNLRSALAGLPTGARQAIVRPPSREALQWAPFAYLHEQRVVENTGLEPVTSWLQTRRSPS